MDVKSVHKDTNLKKNIQIHLSKEIQIKTMMQYYFLLIKQGEMKLLMVVEIKETGMLLPC